MAGARKRKGEEELGVRARGKEGYLAPSRARRACNSPSLAPNAESALEVHPALGFYMRTRVSLKRIQNYFTLINKSSEQCSIGTNMLLSLTITFAMRCMSFYVYLQIIKT